MSKKAKPSSLSRDQRGIRLEKRIHVGRWPKRRGQLHQPESIRGDDLAIPIADFVDI